MTQPRFLIISQAQRAPHTAPTSAALPDTITPHTRAHRHTHTTRQATPTTTARQRHGARHPKQRTPTSHARHIAHANAARKHTRPARPHDVPHSRNHCALPEHHCTHNATCTPHTARHTAPTTPYAANRKSHPVTHAASAPHSRQSCQAAQRRRDAAGEMVATQPQCPAGHTNSHRVTPWHPTPPPTPASRPQRISAHRIASIKSSQLKASQHTARYHSRTTPCASDLKYDPTRQPTGA
jgi:hypothetical protein